MAFGEFVCEPLEMEGRKEAFYVDGDVDRNSPKAVLEFLRKKYGTAKLINVTFTRYEATARVWNEH
jgi:hypothetical protein